MIQLVFVNFYVQADQMSDFKTSDRFQSSLNSLIDSARKLENGNDQLREENERLSQSSDRLNERLKVLDNEANQISEESQKMEEIKKQRTQEGDELNKEFNIIQQQWDELQQTWQSRESHLNELNEIEAAIPVPQKGKQEVHSTLKLKLAASNSAGQSKTNESIMQSIPDSPQANIRKEKLKVLKMILESQKRQQEIQNKIFSLKPHKDLKSERLASLERQKQLNLDRKEKLQHEISKLSAENSAVADAPVVPEAESISSEKISQTENQLLELIKKHRELLSQMNNNTESAKSTAKSDIQIREAHQLESNIETLNKENKVLRQKVKELRRQMVDLDKRKQKTELRLRGM